MSYGGRAAEVMGVQPFTLPSGHCVDVLVLLHTAAPRGIVRVPVDRVADNVRKISKREAAYLDENIQPVRTRIENQLQRARAAAAAKAADFGREGALRRARSRAQAA